MAQAIEDVTIMGSGLSADVRQAISKAKLSGSTSEVTQIDLSLTDPDWRILGSGLIAPAMRVELLDFKLEIASITTGDNGGVESLDIKCRPIVVRKLKNRRGKKVMKSSSPSEFVISECKAVGASYLVESSHSRATVSRDVPKKGEQEVNQPPSSWTTFQRLARELGFYVFEMAGTIFFGRPSWLMSHASGATVTARYASGAVDNNRTLTAPKCSRSEDDPQTTVGVSMLVPDATYARPGGKLTLSGVPTFNGPYLITSFSMDLLETIQIAAIEAGTPLNPEPNPPTTGKTTTTTRLGTRLASDFIYWINKQVGDKYQSGVSVNLDSSNPNVFDGSELIEWGAARVGVFMPTHSNDQIEYCKNNGTEVSLSTGIATKGAILWRKGSTAISLGGGKVIEQVNGKVGIRTSGASSKYSRAGKIPGLLYK